MVVKKCKTCLLEFSIDNFYKHKQMLDGYLNICKKCTCIRIKKERRLNPDKHSARERKRYTGNRKVSIDTNSTNYRKNNSDKYLAHTALNNAVRDGRIIKPDSCELCSRTNIRICGHHDDYSKKLDVKWLCDRCHRRYHADIGMPF